MDYLPPLLLELLLLEDLDDPEELLLELDLVAELLLLDLELLGEYPDELLLLDPLRVLLFLFELLLLVLGVALLSLL